MGVQNIFPHHALVLTPFLKHVTPSVSFKGQTKLPSLLVCRIFIRKRSKSVNTRSTQRGFSNRANFSALRESLKNEAELFMRASRAKAVCRLSGFTPLLRSNKGLFFRCEQKNCQFTAGSQKALEANLRLIYRNVMATIYQL